MLSSNAFRGNTTLPVNRNNSTRVMAPIVARTAGSRELIALALSWLICANPVIAT